MQELHVGLLSGIGGDGWLEVHSFPIEHYTTRPLIVEDHKAIANDAHGTGVTFDWKKLKTLIFCLKLCGELHDPSRGHLSW